MKKDERPTLAATALARTQSGLVLLVERNRELSVFGGFTAFPGGRVEQQDADLARLLLGTADEQACVTAAALRELYEETGLFLEERRLVRGSGSPRPATLLDVVASTGRAIDPAVLHFMGFVTSADWMHVRFQTGLVFVDVDESDDPMPDEREVARAEWMTAEAALRRWRGHAMFLAPETASALSLVAGVTSSAPIRTFRGNVPNDVLEPTLGVRQVPLLSPTLPPARHTNCYVLGSRRLVVVDPATHREEERARLLAFLDVLESRGCCVEQVVLTHHHEDHVAAARWLAEVKHVPILAHPITRTLLFGAVATDLDVVDGQVLDAGVVHGAAGDLRWRVSHTPGHAPGHIVLVGERGQSVVAIVAGDMIAGIGTIVIDPPEGNMAEYLKELARLRDMRARIVFPAHGVPRVDGASAFSALIEHRLMRENKVISALQALGPATVPDIVAQAYDDTPPALHGFASRSCLAHLQKLVGEGRAVESHGRFAPKTPLGQNP